MIAPASTGDIPAALWSAEAEMSVLGAMLIDERAVAEVVGLLREADFRRDGNRRLFRAMVLLWERKEPIDAITLSEALKDAGDLEAVGGMPYVAQLLDAVPTAANVRHHASTVQEKAALRSLWNVSLALVDLLRSPGGRKAEDVFGEATRLLNEAAPEVRGQPMVRAGDLILPVMAEWEKMGTPQEDRGIRTGVEAVDSLIGGHRRGDMVVYAARPSQGKSAWLYCNVMAEASIRQGLVGALFSAETRKSAIVSRIIASEGRVNVYAARKRGGFRDYDYPNLSTAAGLLQRAPLYIDDRARTLDQMHAKLRQVVREEGRVDIIGWDYIQKFRHPDAAKFREREIAELSQGAKEMALEFNAVAVILAQLSRAVEQRPDKRPMMSDLRESGAIEMDADVIGFIYRPEFYFGPTMEVGKGKEAHKINVEGKAEIIFAKVRDGEIGTAHTAFRKEFTRFEDL